MLGTSDERYEELRGILEKQNERSYTFEEAREIGDGLIDFFTLLLELENEPEAQDATDDSIV